MSAIPRDPMPWTLDRYPPAVRRLPLRVRVKAIEIANAMLAEGYDEGQTIRMAIAAAKKWARTTDDAASSERHGADAPPLRAAMSADARKRIR